ncbi:MULTISPECIES: carbohydrate kinase family protein [unclassified Gordonia (in: high G+C Gram-positive bacteria)]|uniref:carbohydrate kinase family protein n=1 Tax=unclassified Gordonia (in: high G+C Gram-positive bacteria) TaxID=2657482 RepID=UPI001F0F104D|nr:carbohydrate kinase family protein [Gordonia sp. ABSL49_1]MCH5642344.1 carbohydrate kinase family protein [Gordonia sp. ABSL49_1]
MRVVTFGAHVLDVLAQPVDAIPDGQGSVLVQNMRMSAAGPAGGTAITLAKLGAEVFTVGAIGDDDAGAMLDTALNRFGVVTDHLVRVDAPTSMSMLPIRSNGDRPAIHMPGANLAYPLDRAPLELLTGADHVHIGAPELLNPPELAPLLGDIRESGTTVSADILADGDPGVLAWLEPILPHLDYLLPNDDQVRGLTAIEDLVTACRSLIDRGVRCVAVTAGADGAHVVTADDAEHAEATGVEVVDTSGCGDAFSAGFLAARGHDLSLLDSARVGCTVAGIVATGLGSDHGDFTWGSITAN